MLENYEYIINHDRCVYCMDFDSTVIGSFSTPDGQIQTTGEGLSDVALAVCERLGNDELYKSIDQVLRSCMDGSPLSFVDSLNLRFAEFQKFGLKREDLLVGAKKAQFSFGFKDYLDAMEILVSKTQLGYEPYYFLSGGFFEMISDALIPLIGEERVEKVVHANYLKFSGDQIIDWDEKRSRMYQEMAKGKMVKVLRESGKIPAHMLVSALGDGSNDIGMGDERLFVAYTQNSRRESVVQAAGGVEALNFYEVLVFHTSPEDRRILRDLDDKSRKSLLQGMCSLQKRLAGIKIHI